MFVSKGREPSTAKALRLAAAVLPFGLLLLPLLLPPAAQAHHLMHLLHLKPTPLTGLLSGLAHPVLGPDHLLFLLALSLVGLRQRASWMLGLLAVGLGGSVLGLALPGLPLAEPLVSFSLVVVALVLLGRLDRRLLLPAFALHGYVLSAAVLGWNPAPIGLYLVGLLLSQGALLLFALGALRHTTDRFSVTTLRTLAAVLLGCGAAWTWSALVG
jgi:urease accessory protein